MREKKTRSGKFVYAAVSSTRQLAVRYFRRDYEGVINFLFARSIGRDLGAIDLMWMWWARRSDAGGEVSVKLNGGVSPCGKVR